MLLRRDNLLERALKLSLAVARFDLASSFADALRALLIAQWWGRFTKKGRALGLAPKPGIEQKAMPSERHRQRSAISARDHRNRRDHRRDRR